MDEENYLANDAFSKRSLELALVANEIFVTSGGRNNEKLTAALNNELKTREAEVDVSQGEERSKCLQVKVPAQCAFEVMHFMSKQINAGERGVVSEGHERVVERLDEAILLEFKTKVVLGAELSDNPEMADLSLSYNDLECIGNVALALPTYERMIELGFAPEDAEVFLL